MDDKPAPQRDRHWYIVVTGKENDRSFFLSLRKFGLEIQGRADTWQPHT
jgi:hypothetical protein